MVKVGAQGTGSWSSASLWKAAFTLTHMAVGSPTDLPKTCHMCLLTGLCLTWQFIALRARNLRMNKNGFSGNKLQSVQDNLGVISCLSAIFY